MNTGSEVGALLVDGLGDGVAVACPSQDLAFLRNMSFGVLQGSRMRNTKTGQPPIKAEYTILNFKVQVCRTDCMLSYQYSTGAY